MKRLVIVRHGESEWNQKNLFTGWVDVELSDKGRAEAKRAGQALRAAGIDFDICFTSYLRRAINTQQIILKEMDREWLPVYKSFKLNERHYGALSGLNKKETHGNSLRSLIKYFEHISDEEIINVEIPTGTPLVYEFDDDFNVVKKYYLDK